jgi:FkbM family methyltransferase
MQVKAALVGATKRVLALGGVDVHRRGVCPSWKFTFDIVKRYGLTPKTIFDIGVATGTPTIYDHFPDATYHLVDPTRESLPHMRALAGRLRATVHNVALGDTEGSMTIATRPDMAVSSLFEEVGEAEISDRYEVPVRRFDRLVGPFERPALMKVDVQGAELMVLRGAGDRLAEIDILIVETSTIASLHGAPEFRDVFAHLDERGFVLWDIVSLNRRPLDSALAQFDPVFVPVGSPLRADRRW